MKYKIVIFIFSLLWAGLIYRVYSISIKSNFYYEKLAKENIEKKMYMKPIRGEILDRNGKILAQNKIGFSISIAPHLRRRGKDVLDNTIDKIISYFPKLDKKVMLKVYKKSSSPYNHKFIKVVDFIKYENMINVYPTLSVDKNINIEAETSRFYPYGKYLSHITGYIGRSNKKENRKNKIVDIVGKIGKSGLERTYNDILQGELGYTIHKVTARNREIQLLKKVYPRSNRDIKTNIDVELQKMIYDRFGDASGAVVVMRTNGEILSAVSVPSFDPNMFVGGISFKNWKILQDNLDHPFTNKFIHGTYPPGSSIKMGMALAFSKSMPKVLDTPETCIGYIKLGKRGHKFRCWNRYGHGKTTLRKAIRESCDVYFYEKSLKVGINNMAKYLKLFGLGVKTGIDLPLEYKGVIPDKNWKRRRYGQPWYKGETVIASIGQGFVLSTPMQIARYTALLASSNLVTPQIAQKVDGERVQPIQIPMKFNINHLTQIRNGMYDVCNSKKGTAYKALHNLPFLVAGKTGTSQVVSISQHDKVRMKEKDMEYYRRSHAWITTYAPFDNPQIVVTAIVEHGGHGGSTAGPIVADIYRWLDKHNYIKKKENRDVE
ncbi:Cell division protein FtsI [Peptidoglycan synthetase] [hydrothermal vent metagenome]|uniref:Cell division protein FtsI [Peptidoglycan synthetase] n=1 Tax=hydrothermal vent metagenome TaxID=652676 RepID=A0A1W1EJK6_9ZZZZ